MKTRYWFPWVIVTLVVLLWRVRDLSPHEPLNSYISFWIIGPLCVFEVLGCMWLAAGTISWHFRDKSITPEDIRDALYDLSRRMHPQARGKTNLTNGSDKA